MPVSHPAIPSTALYGLPPERSAASAAASRAAISASQPLIAASVTVAALADTGRAPGDDLRGPGTAAMLPTGRKCLVLIRHRVAERFREPDTGSPEREPIRQGDIFRRRPVHATSRPRPL